MYNYRRLEGRRRVITWDKRFRARKVPTLRTIRGKRRVSGAYKGRGRRGQDGWHTGSIWDRRFGKRGVLTHVG